MATERFPKQMYLRQLRKMRDDLWHWEWSYKQGERDTDNAWLAGRFAERGGALELMRYDLDQLIDHLDMLPRLS